LIEGFKERNAKKVKKNKKKKDGANGKVTKMK